MEKSTMSNGKQNRIGYFDILRGIAIVLMVMGHVGFGEGFSKYIHTFHMPMFFFVSGYFYNAGKYINAKTYILHEIKTLIIPYTVFVLICQPLHYIYTHEFSFRYFIISYFSSNHNRIDVAGAYWFLLCLFTAKILFYYIDRYTKGIWKAVLIIGITLAGNLMPVKLPFCLDSAMSCLAVIYIGYLLRKYQKEISELKILSIHPFLLVLLFIANIILILLNGIVNIRTNDFACIPLFWINCILAILCYTNISVKMDRSTFKPIQIISSGLKYLGKNSIVFLVLNEMMIFAVGQMFSLFGISTVNFSNGIIYYVVQLSIFVVCMILLSLAAELFNHTKLKLLLGKF